jgi:hypothetical protein
MGRELIALLVLAAACKREEPPGPPPAIGAAAPPLAAKPYYRLDAAPQPACAANTACDARLALTALGDYHVNKQYPFKLVGDPNPDIQLDGTGTFAFDGDKAGTLTVKFRAAKPGTAKVTGMFKLSVCTDANCEIDTPKIAFDVTAR